MSFSVTRRLLPALVLALGAFIAAGVSAPLEAQVTAFKQAVAEAAHGNEAVATYYRTHNYAPIFTGKDDARRRSALLKALDEAATHGLPSGRYDPERLKAAFKAAKSPRDLGKAEVMAAEMFVKYAQDI